MVFLEVMSPLNPIYGITTAVSDILVYSKITTERQHTLPPLNTVGLGFDNKLRPSCERSIFQ